MQRKKLTPAERLIVAADFRPEGNNGRQWVRQQVIKLAKSLKDTGVYLKVNSALRACGYNLIDEIHEQGLRVFADLKLFDISNTLADDGVLLAKAKPELLTVVCGTGGAAITSLKNELPETEVLGVTVLTSLNAAEALRIHGVVIQSAVRQLTDLASRAGVDGFICAATEVSLVRGRAGTEFTINTPGIRPRWAHVLGDDQNPDRAKTPVEAMSLGADRIVVGRPITKPPQGMTSRDAVMRTIEEIASVVG